MSDVERPKSIFESLRIIDGRAPLWPLHVARMTRSARELGMNPPALVEPRDGPDRVIRLEFDGATVQHSERAVGSTAPISLHVTTAQHHGYRHKLVERTWLDAAHHGAAAIADDVLFCAPDGCVLESSRWAIGWWNRDRLEFPPLSLGILPSVARARLAQIARGGIAEVAAGVDALTGRVLVACNAVRGLVDVSTLDGQALPCDARASGLMKRFWDVAAA